MGMDDKDWDKIFSNLNLKDSSKLLVEPMTWRTPNKQFGGYNIWVPCDLGVDNYHALYAIRTITTHVYQYIKENLITYRNDPTIVQNLKSFSYYTKNDNEAIRKWMKINDLPNELLYYVIDSFGHAVNAVKSGREVKTNKINIDFSHMGSYEETEGGKYIFFHENPKGLERFFVSSISQLRIKGLYDELAMCKSTYDFQLLTVSAILKQDNKLCLCFYFKSTDPDSPYDLPPGSERSDVTTDTTSDTKSEHMRFDPFTNAEN